MSMSRIKVPARLESAAQDRIVTGASSVFDDTIGAYQNIINNEVRRDITALSQTVSTLGGMDVITYTSADIDVDVSPDCICIWPTAMSNLTIQLISPDDITKAAVYTCIINVGTTPNISISGYAGETVIAPQDFYIEPSCINEVQILYAGGTFYMRSINYK